MEDSAIILLKKELNDIKLLNEQLRKLLRAKGEEKFYVIIENLVKLESKLNDLLLNFNTFLKTYSKNMEEIENIKKEVRELKLINNKQNEYLNQIVALLNDLKSKKK